jgi:hypothetical protein
VADQLGQVGRPDEFAGLDGIVRLVKLQHSSLFSRYSRHSLSPQSFEINCLSLPNTGR